MTKPHSRIPRGRKKSKEIISSIDSEKIRELNKIISNWYDDMPRGKELI